VTGPSDIPALSTETPGLLDQVVAVLTDAGFAPEVDDDGDVAFRFEDQLLFVRYTDGAPGLLRVFGQWQLGPEAPGTWIHRMQAANVVTGALSLVKASIYEDRLSVAIDLLLTGPVDLRAMVVATADAVLDSVRAWHTALLELTEASE